VSDSSVPRPPLHLGPAGKRLWRKVQAEFVLSEWQFAILESACVAADRQEEARQLIAAEGLVQDTGKLGLKPHPAVAIEQQARTGMLRALRELALQPEDVAEAPRPPRIAGRYVRTGA
jgi:P27 family predicted phage terminase small subunit